MKKRILRNYFFSFISPLSLYWIFFLLLIFIFTFFVPPFQKPDEELHFLKAMTFARGQLKCTKGDGNSYFVLPNAIVNFPNQMRLTDILMRPDVKFPIGVLKQKYPFLNDNSENTTFRFCIASSLGYAPYAISALLSYPFDNLLVTFYFMRVVSAVLFIITVLISLKIIPKRYKILLLFFSSLPMVIHQVTAISYDSMPYFFGIVLFAYLCSLLDKKQITYGEFFIFLFITVIFSVVKYGYYFVYLFPFLLLSKLPLKRLHIFIIGGASIVIMILCYFLFADNARTAGSYILETQFSQQMFMVLHYPLKFLQIIMNTIFEDSNKLIQGMIGTFGWLDYTLTPLMTYFYVIIGGYVTYITVHNDRQNLSVFSTLCFFIVFFINLILIFSIFYVMITSVAYYRVFGTQGRHFLIFIPFLIYAFSQSMQNIRKSRLLQTLGVSVMGFMAILAISLLIYNRYFYYGRSFSNPTALEERIKQKEFELSKLKQIPITKSMSFISNYPIEGNKVGGFQLLVLNELDITLPYQYVIKDKTCMNILQVGFLDRIKGPKLSHLGSDKNYIYTQYLPITKVRDQAFCIELAPLLTEGGTPLILLGQEIEKPIIDFLSIIQ